MSAPALLRVALGEELRRVRQQQGRGLRDVAESASISLGYLSEIERGTKEASSELLNAICGSLNLHLGSLLIALGESLLAPTAVVLDITPSVAPATAAA